MKGGNLLGPCNLALMFISNNVILSACEIILSDDSNCTGQHISRLPKNQYDSFFDKVVYDTAAYPENN